MKKDIKKKVNKVIPIQSVDELNFNQILMGHKWEQFKEYPISRVHGAMEYLEDLIDGRHVFLLHGYGIENETQSNLYVLVHFESEDEDDMMDYFLYPVEDELWSPIGREHQLFDQDRPLFDALQKIGVEPLDSSNTRLGKAIEAFEESQATNQR